MVTRQHNYILGSYTQQARTKLTNHEKQVHASTDWHAYIFGPPNGPVLYGYVPLGRHLVCSSSNFINVRLRSKRVIDKHTDVFNRCCEMASRCKVVFHSCSRCQKGIITENLLVWSSPYHIADWYGGCHTCNTVSGATGIWCGETRCRKIRPQSFNAVKYKKTKVLTGHYEKSPIKMLRYTRSGVKQLNTNRDRMNTHWNRFQCPTCFCNRYTRRGETARDD